LDRIALHAVGLVSLIISLLFKYVRRLRTLKAVILINFTNAGLKVSKMTNRTGLRALSGAGVRFTLNIPRPRLRINAIYVL